MNPTQRITVFTLSLGLTLATTFAKPVPSNLGNGLDRLVESNLAVKASGKQSRGSNLFVTADGQKFANEETAGLDALALKNPDGRLLVRINLDGTVPALSLKDNLAKAIGSITVTAVDDKYHGVGAMNAYVSIDDVPALAQTPGVSAVIQELKPRHNKALPAPAPGERPVPSPDATPGEVITQLGTYTDQGVIQHKVDAINKFYNPSAASDFRGTNMSIACISNSFNANATNPASIDVANNDLPGNASNPAGNTTPVFVLLDDLSSSTSDDEGRGMCQIVYKMAPKARVGFSTADTGEVGFANAIRGLAGINSADFPSASSQGFAADVICDDVGYFDEPFYEDGIIGAGVNDAVAAGVSYFSSAANDIGINGYESVIRVVPNGTGLTAAAGNTALANTNINLANVPPAFYAGGFHNFNPNGGLDVAQTVNVASNNTVPTILQWNDPYDQNGGFQSLGAQIFSASGTISNTTTTQTYNGTSTPPLPPFNAGQGYQIVEKATSGNFDAIITVIDPSGTTILTQDTGTDETVNFVAPVSGQYQIRVGRFSTTTGNYTLTVNLATIVSYVKSDWNLLAFRTDTGAYVSASSLTSNNLANNQPVEIGYVNRTSATTTSIQYVLARSNTPTGPNIADHIRYLLPGNGLGGYGPQEYFTYNTVTTSGHAHAAGCNGTAAYSPFRPNIPEGFTSPGPAMIYFDANQNRLNPPQIRLQPRVAALDGGNISANEGAAGLGTDDPSDYDAAANFYGTSAAAPHAAACALLVLEAHGGRGSVTPAQMTTILQNTAFMHDLDPNYSSGAARATNGGKVTLTMNSDQDSNTNTGQNDPNSLSVSYVGPSYITSLVFNPQGTAATGGNTTAGNNGLNLATNDYFTNSYPGMVFPSATTSFTVGSQSVGLVQADVTASTSNLAPPPSTAQNWTLNLTFPNNNFTGGKVLRFKINRAIQHSSVLPSGTSPNNASADLFGGSVLIPEGTGSGVGMTFNGTLGDGSTFSGTINNRIGKGYSVLDGYGFINVQDAAAAPLP